ncbi:MAG: dihydrofolate reductase family protein, partial [Actinomycetota bacterium]|nr:dihydrofolate reductase family protein [Actinomycetota bacterium]
EWATRSASWKESHGLDPSAGDSGADDDVIAEASIYGAVIMGKRMFCGEDGPWGDDPFQGWWGDDPPFKVPVFVLTHHPRDVLELGETRFEFVTDGTDAALERAREAAGDEDVHIAGGADVATQYVAAGVVDEMQIHIAPILLGGGARLFDSLGLDAPRELKVTRVVESPYVTHVRYEPA